MKLLDKCRPRQRLIKLFWLSEINAKLIDFFSLNSEKNDMRAVTIFRYHTLEVFYDEISHIRRRLFDKRLPKSYYYLSKQIHLNLELPTQPIMTTGNCKRLTSNLYDETVNKFFFRNQCPNYHNFLSRVCTKFSSLHNDSDVKQ